MDALAKVRHTIDAQFGRGTHRALPRDATVEYSKRTGRIRAVRRGSSSGDLLIIQRPDGSMAVSMAFAQMMVSRMRGSAGMAGPVSACCIEVTAEAAPFVAEGRSVFCRHVARCGRRIRANSDVLVTYEGRVVAVGRALLPYEIIRVMGRGVAVRVRDSLKGRGK